MEKARKMESKEDLTEGIEEGILFLCLLPDWKVSNKQDLGEDFLLPYNPIFLNEGLIKFASV